MASRNRVTARAEKEEQDARAALAHRIANNGSDRAIDAAEDVLARALRNLAVNFEMDKEWRQSVARRKVAFYGDAGPEDVVRHDMIRRHPKSDVSLRAYLNALNRGLPPQRRAPVWLAAEAPIGWLARCERGIENASIWKWTLSVGVAGFVAGALLPFPL